MYRGDKNKSQHYVSRKIDIWSILYLASLGMAMVFFFGVLIYYCVQRHYMPWM